MSQSHTIPPHDSMDNILSSIKKIIADPSSTQDEDTHTSAYVAEDVTSPPEPCIPAVTSAQSTQKKETASAPQAAITNDISLSSRVQDHTKNSFSDLVHAHKRHTDTVSLESLVLKALTPLLNTWIEKNLPPLVEKIIKKEIERVTQSL